MQLSYKCCCKAEGNKYKITLGSEKANPFILVKCFDEPPSTTYAARVKGAPTKPRLQLYYLPLNKDVGEKKRIIWLRGRNIEDIAIFNHMDN